MKKLLTAILVGLLVAVPLHAAGVYGGIARSVLGTFADDSGIGGGIFSDVARRVIGTSTNDNAIAGYVGEYVTATVAAGSAVSLTTNTAANVTSISLTAGDWDVSGSVDYTFGATTSFTELSQSISTTTATLGTQDQFNRLNLAANVPTATNNPMVLSTPVVRISVAGTTTVYLVTKGTFTVSTLAAYGTIRARRVR